MKKYKINVASKRFEETEEISKEPKNNMQY